MNNRRSFLKRLAAGGAAALAAPFVPKAALPRPVLTVDPLAAPVKAVAVKVPKMGAWVKCGNVLVWDNARSLDDPTFNG